MLSRSWSAHRAHYDFLIIGSGYGGAIAAARLATAKVSPRPSICVLERGREWPIGSFPDTVPEILWERRGPLNPLGLYDLLTFPDISVIKGNGLGGTSLAPANLPSRLSRVRLRVAIDERVISRRPSSQGKARAMVPFFIPASTLRDSLLAFLPHKILGSGGVPNGGNDERPKNRGAPRMVCATSANRLVGAGGDR